MTEDLNALSELKTRLAEISDFGGAAALLRWDQTTYMPPGGAEARGRQISRLRRLTHEMSTDPALGDLISRAEDKVEALPYESDAAGIVREARRNYDRAVKVPPDFMAELSQHTTATYDLWGRARPADDFGAVREALEKTLDLSRGLAGFFPGYDHIADPLIDFRDYGMTAESIREVFGELRSELVPMVEAIREAEPIDAAPIKQHFPEPSQLAFGEEVIRDLGYDFDRGRIDKTLHPFMTKFSLGDVRITTRVEENDLGQALFSTMHEAGHAMYEQGIDRSYEGTPLGGGTSSGVHESQSRLWENVVGRSQGFWSHYYPSLQQTFPDQLGDVDVLDFVKAVNKVEASLIRTDADEVTYNLHVMIRFDLELAMLEGDLAVSDLPEAWRERYQSDLGVASPDDKNGVLQDVHWFGGTIGGAFQGYTLGNIMSAQFYDAAVRAHSEIPDQIAEGRFDTLRGWLTDNVYRHGSKFTASELLQRATGSDLTIEPYMGYLRNKYGALYGLEF